MKSSLSVVIGILKNHKQEVLIALRPKHVPMPNVWEFPGGKAEPNETLDAALRREWREEIGIDVQSHEFIKKFSYETDEKIFTFHVFLITCFSGEPRGCENQKISWAPIFALNNYVFPKANQPIIQYLQSCLR